MTTEKMFPLQTSRNAPPGPLSIPWSVAERAYGAYAQQYGRGQSLERLAERGGFGWCEMDTLAPGWREEVSEIARLRGIIATALTNLKHFRTVGDEYGRHALWSHVGYLFGLGSTSASALCVEFGVDPSQLTDGEEPGS